MKVLLTGGGGFLGGSIVRRLIERGETVRSFSRSHYPELEALDVESFTGNLDDLNAVMQAVEGCDTVFHVAAKAGVWGPYEDYYKTNVVGTENIIEACRQHNVPKLIYTSTPSATFNGVDEDGVDESAPYATNFLCHYAKTKAEAEKKVLTANCDSLATVALRPHLIWGPGDNHLVPRVIERGRTGKLKLLGKKQKLVDSVYIDNATDAHILVADSLSPNSPCAGKAYFITNGEPLPMGELLNKILATADIPPITKTIPPGLAYAVGAMMEAVYTILGKKEEPIMTRFVAKQLSTSHWFDISAAKRDFGYEPKVSIDEGMKRLRTMMLSEVLYH